MTENTHPERDPAADRELRAEVMGLRRDLHDVSLRNTRLVETLSNAREELVRLKAEAEQLAQPPNSFGTVLAVTTGGDSVLVDVLQAGRKMRVSVSADINPDDLVVGREVTLNESLVIVAVCDFERTGELYSVKEFLGDDRALVIGHADDERVVTLSGELRNGSVRVGDALTVDTRSGLGYEKIPRAEVQNLVLEEVPDIGYRDVGGLNAQIEQIQDAVELPFLHSDLYREHNLRAPKGILLYGPPGCGKTLIAKAVANALSKRVGELRGTESERRTEAKSYFLNIKGPELLDKYVGETERHIRLIFARAREKASEGSPVVVFFDEMDSLFRTRGTGVSSDVETTIVPQLLSEIDGVERLDNVIVIGASNREDMIDPAILRPGRLDVKIKIERPDADAAIDIFGKYLTPDLPLHPDDLAEHGGDAARTVANMIQRTVERMYADDESNEFLEVTYANGDKEILYFKDFASGAMIQNIVDRAKKAAIKDFLGSGTRGLRVDHLLAACVDEFREHEDLPNTTNPDDWAKISGKKGERIVYIRTIIQSKEGTVTGKSIDTLNNTGQYL
ncbi:proteasome ATPase [Spelaeicoccus albus]|uniref:AAA ATPase forming ring-shaped complexes n=1 Tax=Spelaeicoccus albus TaxID=1280376 RepID=A0A7Z0IID7_9MICO|nr:proteasome-associated ATPase [Spelaeicoccus albus]